MLEPSSQVKTTAAMLQQLRASVNPDLGKLDGLTRAVLHKVSDGILFLDLNGKIVEANESAQKYLGVLDFWEAILGCIPGRSAWVFNAGIS
jgi:PAS domain-containing protein